MTKRHVLLFDILFPLAGIAAMGWLCSEAFALPALRFLDQLEWLGLGAWFRSGSLRVWAWQASWPLFSLACAALWGLWVMWNRETDFSTGGKRQERPIYTALRHFFEWIEEEPIGFQMPPPPESELEILREKLRRTERELALFKRATHSAQIGEISATESAELRLPRYRAAETTSYRIPLPDLPNYEAPEPAAAREERLRRRATESATWLRNTYNQVAPTLTPRPQPNPMGGDTLSVHPASAGKPAYGAGIHSPRGDAESGGRAEPPAQNRNPKPAFSSGPSPSMRLAIESASTLPAPVITKKAPPSQTVVKPKPAPVPEWGGMIAQEIAEQAEGIVPAGDSAPLRSFRAESAAAKPSALSPGNADRFAGLAKL